MKKSHHRERNVGVTLLAVTAFFAYQAREAVHNLAQNPSLSMRASTYSYGAFVGIVACVAAYVYQSRNSSATYDC